MSLDLPKPNQIQGKRFSQKLLSQYDSDSDEDNNGQGMLLTGKRASDGVFSTNSKLKS